VFFFFSFKLKTVGRDIDFKMFILYKIDFILCSVSGIIFN